MTGEIKICGTASFDDLEVAISEDIDAVGIIWHPTRHTRHTVDTSLAIEIVRLTPQNISTDWLPRSRDPAEILSMATLIKPRRIQLGEVEDPYLTEKIASHQNRPVRQAIHIGENVTLKVMDDFAPYVDSFLLDTAGERPGGNGVTHDWRVSRRFVERGHELGRKVVLAGGLTAQNVAEAIRTARPDGVDVETSIKDKQGNHDPVQIKNFVQSARSAFEELQEVQ